jgi:hypothetical protein
MTGGFSVHLTDGLKLVVRDHVVAASGSNVGPDAAGDVVDNGLLIRRLIDSDHVSRVVGLLSGQRGVKDHRRRLHGRDDRRKGLITQAISCAISCPICCISQVRFGVSAVRQESLSNFFLHQIADACKR